MTHKRELTLPALWSWITSSWPSQMLLFQIPTLMVLQENSKVTKDTWPASWLKLRSISQKRHQRPSTRQSRRSGQLSKLKSSNRKTVVSPLPMLLHLTTLISIQKKFSTTTSRLWKLSWISAWKIAIARPVGKTIALMMQWYRLRRTGLLKRPMTL